MSVNQQIRAIRVSRAIDFRQESFYNQSMIIEIAPENGEKNLLELLRKKGYPVVAPCGGNGRCGGCKVFLNGQEVLACKTEIDDKCAVEIPERSSIRSAPITENKGQTEGETYFAVDIGTTTVTAALCHGKDIVEATTFDNPQLTFGADVLSRIQNVKKAGVEALRRPLLSALDSAMRALSEKRNVFPEKAYVCGNTVMLHLFWGEDPTPLGVAPYKPVFLNGREEKIPELNEITVVSLPCVSSYIGADIAAGIASCPLPKKDKLSLLIDLGTNAEIALVGAERILTASAAAGPCFEGGNISCGMPATEGAVTAFSLERRRVSFIGTKPLGLCGTGLIDVIGQLRKANIIDETGFLSFKQGYPIAPSVILTQDDVRQFQLAKSAVRSGIDVLLKEAKITCGDVEKVYLAGGVSTGISVENAVYAGLLPTELAPVCVPAKNSALAGTVLYSYAPEKIEKVIEKARYIDLASTPLFSEYFIKNIDFR